MSYVLTCYAIARHAATDSCDASMRLSPVTTRWRRQAVTFREMTAVKSRPHDMSVCHEKRHWDRERERLRSVRRNKCYTHRVRVGVVTLQNLGCDRGGRCARLIAQGQP